MKKSNTVPSDQPGLPWPVKPILVLLLMLMWSGCATQFTNDENLPCTISHTLEDGKLHVVATVQNRWPVPVTFVRHSIFFSLEVLPRDRTKATHDGNYAFVEYSRASPKALELVPSGGRITFEQFFPYQRLDDTTIRIKNGPFLGSYTSRDTHLKVKFHYEHDPFYLPRQEFLTDGNFRRNEILEEGFPGPNYAAEIAAEEVFLAP